MSRRKVTRREAIKNTTLGVGAIAASSFLSAKASPPPSHPVQVTLTLDSGTFLDEIRAAEYPSLDVGYFRPDIRFYGDGQELARIKPKKIGTKGKIVEVLHLDAGGNDPGRGVTLSKGLPSTLLRLEEVYGRIIPIDRTRYHSVFRFNSGHFCESKVKVRAFKEIGRRTNQPTGNRRTMREIPHDIDIHYDLAPGESIVIMSDGKVLWASSDHVINRRLDIQVSADNSTAEMFYRDALELSAEENPWLPNQGDPPPMGPP